MSAHSSGKRDRLVEAAAELSYAHGFGHVALADIAERASVPLGNIYYYFKTKVAIGEAVIAQRCAEFEKMRAQWDLQSSPQERLKAFIRMTANNRENLARAGCPIGSLCAELGKEAGPLAEHAARPLKQLLQWIEQQFGALATGKKRAALALHLLAALQGVSLLANGFRNPKLVETEAALLCDWIDGLSDASA
jgi:TetR/AcrR family transcriptional repressor of nem operon